jgi:hypothetical protein
MEAVMIVLSFNLKKFTESSRGMFQPLWTIPFDGATPDSYVHMSASTLLEQPLPPIDALDPYDVYGTYMRVSDTDPSNDTVTIDKNMSFAF